MRKSNQKVVAQQEAFEYYNPVGSEEELKPFWEDADEQYQYSIRPWDFDEDMFYMHQADEYYNTYVKGHTWEEIEADKDLMARFSMWSDLFKDAYGFRPRWV